MLADNHECDEVWEDASDDEAKRRPVRGLNFAPRQLGRGVSENLSISSLQEKELRVRHEDALAVIEAEFN